MSEYERIVAGFEQLKAHFRSCLAQARRPPVPAPTSEQLRGHYAVYNLAFDPKQGDIDEDIARMNDEEIITTETVE